MLGEAAETLELRGGFVVRDAWGTPLIDLERLLRRMHFQAEPELVMVTDYYEPKSKPGGAPTTSPSHFATCISMPCTSRRSPSTR